jgi:putative methionine-R-sulfoxide reductase with GAF domain
VTNSDRPTPERGGERDARNPTPTGGTHRPPLEISGQPYAGALEALHRVLNREPEPDEALRQTVAVLHQRIPHYTWVGLYFVEGEELPLGPSSGAPDSGATRTAIPVVYEGTQTATLGIESQTELDAADRAFLERVAVLISAHCLVGWDTGGVPWPEVT